MKLSSNLQEMLGVEPHSGISTQSAVAIKRLDKEMEGPKKEPPKPHTPEKGKTQKEVFKEVFGEDAAKRREERQKKQLQELLKRQRQQDQ